MFFHDFYHRGLVNKMNFNKLGETGRDWEQNKNIFWKICLRIFLVDKLWERQKQEQIVRTVFTELRVDEIQNICAQKWLCLKGSIFNLFCM